MDINNPEVKANITQIVNKLKTFNPTVICIEMNSNNKEFVNETYQKYIIDQSNRMNYSDEINSIAFEVGRLTGVKKIYGIDSEIAFNYPKLIELAIQNEADSLFVESIIQSYKKNKSTSFTGTISRNKFRRI